MPAPGDIKQDYPFLLKEKLGIELLEPYKGAKIHHLMKCGDCGHEWSATPLSKMQSYRKYPDGNGCPACKKQRENNKHSDTRMDNIKQIRNAGLQILTDGYDGKRGDIYFTIRVLHEDCGHEFDLRVANFLNRKLTRDNSCKICGIIKRSEQLTETSIARHMEWLKTASEWELYKYEVELETRISYRKFKDVINPLNLLRGSEGDMYHLDHIISRRFCFENNIPVELCGHPDNLRMIPWRENISKGMRIVTEIPIIFAEYMNVMKDVEIEDDNEDDLDILFD